MSSSGSVRRVSRYRDHQDRTFVETSSRSSTRGSIEGVAREPYSPRRDVDRRGGTPVGRGRREDLLGDGVAARGADARARPPSTTCPRRTSRDPDAHLVTPRNLALSAGAHGVATMAPWQLSPTSCSTALDRHAWRASGRRSSTGTRWRHTTMTSSLACDRSASPTWRTTRRSSSSGVLVTVHGCGSSSCRSRSA